MVLQFQLQAVCKQVLDQKLKMEKYHKFNLLFILHTV